MSYNYTIKYRTFDQLLSDIQVDFQNISLQNMLEPQQLIKIAKKINYDLGLRIMQTKEIILEVEDGRVRLPDDFYVFNFGLICDNITVFQPAIQGTWIEDKFIPPYQETNAYISPCTDGEVNCSKCNLTPCSCASSCSTSCNTCGNDSCQCETFVGLSCNDCSCNPCTCNASCPGCNTSPCCCQTTTQSPVYNPLVPYGDSCIKPRVFLNCKGDQYELVQIVKGQTFTYSRLIPLRMLENPQTIDCDCPNLYINSSNQAWIKDNFLHTTFKCGKVYMNYQGTMEDQDGNLLVPDHDMLNEYYEYAIKQRILENLLMNDEPGVVNKLQLVEQRLRAARNYALSIVNTPNFAEVKRVFDMNRKVMYSKYYDMFKSYGPYTAPWYYPNQYNTLIPPVR